MLHYILLLIAISSVVDAFSTVIYGPSQRELLFLTSKIAAREGIDASCICAPGTEGLARKLMYGKDYSEKEIDEAGRAKPISTGDDMQESLKKANSLCLICYDQPIEVKALQVLLDAAGEDLSKIVLLSKMGVSKAKGGFFGGGDSKLLESESAIRTLCESKNLDLSIVRAGILKGGGPGREGNDIGLDGCYYNTLIDVVEASVTMAHDKFALGVHASKGDTIELPNMLAQMGSKSSFEPSPYDTNRAAATSAIVASLLYPEPIEFSVSTEKAEEPPSMEEWKGILASL